jgi:23S rRNA G2069 N7-methylase RlmK/C1962 C5-methylase RlmI
MDIKLQSILDFQHYILGMYRISQDEFSRLLEDVMEFFNLTLDDYVRLRHLQLQNQGIKNQEIYSRISQELGQRRFKAPELSERQIRRIVYG